MKRKDTGDSVAPTIKKIFAKNLRTLRIRARQSQELFALANGLNREYVSGLERGQNIPSLETVARAAFGLGVPIAELIDGIESEVVKALKKVYPAPRALTSTRVGTTPYTGPPKKVTLADIKELGVQAALTLLSRKYVNADTAYLWECGAGHRVKAHPGNLRARIKDGRVPCVECARIARPPAKGNLDDVRAIGTPVGFSLKSTQYIDSSTPYLWECSTGHTVRVTTGNLRVRIKKKRIPCPECARIARSK